jgi:hypothetical protein
MNLPTMPKLLRTRRVAALLSAFTAVIGLAIWGETRGQRMGGPTPPRQGYASVSNGVAPVASVQPSGSTSTTYYVDALLGDDRHAGTMPSQPWQRVSRANQGVYHAGDHLLFRGGQTFVGGLRLNGANSRGTAKAPVTIGSYGTGKALIATDEEAGLSARDLGGLRITNLAFRGRTSRCLGGGMAGAHGLVFAGGGRAALRYIHLEQVDVTGYCIGVALFADPPGGYADVRVEQARLSGNHVAGIVLIGPRPTAPGAPYALTDIIVRNSLIVRHPGVPLEGRGVNLSGAGVLVWQASGLVIERNIVHENGGKNACVDGGRTGGGSFAIWASGDRMVVQGNDIYGQRVSPDCPWDGGAIALDGSRSIVQYNYTHDNDGPAVLLDHAPGQHDNVVRYHVSERDGRRSNSPGVLAVTAGDGQYHVHNNTIVAGPHAMDARNPIVFVTSDVGSSPDHPRGLFFRNNLFMAESARPLLGVIEPSHITGLRFENNAYFDREGRYEILWGRERYQGVAPWQEATGQEMVDGDAVGWVGDPLLCGPRSGEMPAPGLQAELRSPRLQSDSPLIDAGWDLAAFGVEMGVQDFFGGPVKALTRPDIGAHEYRPGQSCEASE